MPDRPLARRVTRRLTGLLVPAALAAAALLPATNAPAAAADPLPTPAHHFALAQDLADTAPGGGGAASAVGATSFAGGALTLPGGTTSGTGYVRLPDDLVTGLGDDLTVSVWVRSDTPARNGAALAFTTPTQANGVPAGYWLLNPTGPNGEARSVLTDATNAAQPWTTEVQVAGPRTAERNGSWVNYTTVFTAGTLTAYVDGQRVGTVAKQRSFADLAAGAALQGYLGRSGYAGDPAWRGSLRELQVFDEALSVDQVAQLDAEDGFILQTAAQQLSLGDTSAVRADLTLPTTLPDGVAVSWASSAPGVVDATGRVTSAVADRTARLTATLTRAGASATRTFDVTVLGRAGIVAGAADLLVAPSTLASGDSLPVVAADGVTTTWTTSSPGLATSGAVLTATDTAAATTGTVTARVSAEGATPATKTFPVTVLPGSQARFLLGYTRTPLDTQVHGPNVAHALHLALGASRQGVTPLQHNTGVLFARGVPSATAEVTDVRTLVTPNIFRTREGWGAVAVRTLSGGTPDESAATSMLVFTSPDLRTWTEVGPVPVEPSGDGVRRPAVVWDAAAQRYVASWTTAAGTARAAFSSALAGGWSAPVSAIPQTRSDQATTTATGAVPGNTVVVTAAEARALSARFGRISNTGATVEPVTLPVGGPTAALADSRVSLSYDDGSTATRGVDWDAADLAAVDTSRPGTYTVDGTVRQTDHAFPFITGRADPAIHRWQGRYLFLATNADESAFNLRTAETLGGLRSARDALVLSQRAGLPGPLWAPEFHEIGGALWVFFASGVDQRCWCAVQAHVMRLAPGADPTLAASWETPKLVTERDGGRLQTDRAGISLDMTWFTDTRGGEEVAYVAWSQRYTQDGLGDAQLWIATVDPADPSRLTSEPTLFARPDLGWDHNTSGVVEAPFVVRRGARLVMTYSGSNIDNTYAIGQLSAPAGADLLDPSVWTKQNDPLLVSDAAGRQAGPGHSMFTTDEDGNTVLVYHARTNSGGSRDTGLRRIHWGADDRLVLDMTKDEEVAPANRAVTLTVTVLPTPVTPPVNPPVTPPVTSPVTPPVTPPLPPVQGPGLPPVVDGVVKGKAQVGRPVRLVVKTLAERGRVVVEVAGTKRVVKIREGRGVLSVRFTSPGRKKLVLRTAGEKQVVEVRIRR